MEQLETMAHMKFCTTTAKIEAGKKIPNLYSNIPANFIKEF